MTADEFRRLALQIPGGVESGHMGHPDFRLNGRVFASLGYPDSGYGMVKLSPEQQEAFLQEAPTVCRPCAGAWGKHGATSLRLDLMEADLLRAVLDLASKNVLAKRKAGKGRPAQ